MVVGSIMLSNYTGLKKITKCFGKSTLFVYLSSVTSSITKELLSHKNLFLLILKCSYTVTKQSNIIIKQCYCTKKLLSKRNNLAELMFFFKIGLSPLISKLSLISRTHLLFLFAKMINSSKDRRLYLNMFFRPNF